MDSSPVPKKGILNNNYALGAFVVILVLALIYIFTQGQPGTTTSTTSSSVVTTVNQNITGSNQTTVPQNTTYQNVSYIPTGEVYCIGGFNSTSPTNSTYYADIYNSTYSNASISFYWVQAQNYPISVVGPSCVQSGGFGYCVGGSTFIFNQTNQTQEQGIASTSAVYSTALYENGTSGWDQASSYPVPIQNSACVTSAGYIYCIGGQTNTTNTNSSYFAPLDLSGVGSWKSTTPYPLNLTYASCLAYQGYVYCIGGTNGITSTNFTYYAQLTQSGIGPWIRTSNYPVTAVGPKCVQSLGYEYCTGNNPNFGLPNSTYYAPIDSTGIGRWASTTSYPLALTAPSACTSQGGTFYCMGAADALGDLYGYDFYATINSSGVGQWQQYTAYDTPIASESCFSTA